VLTETRGVAPRRDEVASRDVVTSFEGSRERVLIEGRPVAPGRLDHAQGFEPGSILTPLFDRVAATPLQLLTAIGVVATPQRPVSLIETDDVFDTFERSPCRPRGSFPELVAK
jgi:hypothetical protein